MQMNIFCFQELTHVKETRVEVYTGPTAHVNTQLDSLVTAEIALRRILQSTQESLHTSAGFRRNCQTSSCATSRNYQNLICGKPNKELKFHCNKKFLSPNKFTLSFISVQNEISSAKN